MISILFPTRNRPDRAITAIQSIADTTADYELLIGVDEDDVDHYDWARIGDISEYHCHVYPEMYGSSRKVHDLANKCRGDWLMVGSDDFIWRTPGWVDVLEENCPPDRLICLYPHDDPVKHRGSRIPIITREGYEVTGYYPDLFHHFYADTWVVEIYQDAGRLKQIPILVEHMHAKFGKANDGWTYQRNRGAHQTDLWAGTKPHRDKIAQRLRAEIAKHDLRRVS